MAKTPLRTFYNGTKKIKKMKHIKEFEFFSIPGINHINEEVKQGAQGDPYEYKKDGNLYYARKKGKKVWTQAKGSSADSIKNKIFSGSSKAGSTSTQDIKNIKPYKLTQYSHDDRKYQRDTFVAYSRKNIEKIQTGELKAQQLTRGIVPIKKESKIKPHYRIFGDFLSARKNPLTSADFTKEELKTMSDMIKSANPTRTPKNVNFPALAGVNFSKVKAGTEDQKNIDDKKSIAYVLGNSQVADNGATYKVTDIYDFNNYHKNPENYTLEKMPITISTAFRKIFSGNLVQGVEELASYYQKLGYKGIPVSIDVPKNIV